MGVWERHTVTAIHNKGDDGIGFKFENGSWCWIPQPPILVAIGDRIAVYRFMPVVGFTVRCVIGELEVPTFYQQEMERLRKLAKENHYG